MRCKWVPLALLPLAGIAAAALPVLRGGPATGTPDISGSWTGKLLIKDFDLGPAGTKEVQKCPFEMTVGQTGAVLSLTMTVACEGGKLSLFTLGGLIGSGHFAAEQEGALEGGIEEILLSGTVTGDGTKMKGVGVFVSASAESASVAELKFNAKRVPPPR